jgi:hypothetical protein
VSSFKHLPENGQVLFFARDVAKIQQSLPPIHQKLGLYLLFAEFSAYKKIR